MTSQTPRRGTEEGAHLDPIFISVKQAARLLNLTPWSVYQLCDEGTLESQYFGKRRLVRLTSVRAFADGLPTERDAS
jgi:excisionase family DNA binding protein